MAAELEDVVQEVFVTCFKEDGPLSRADPERPGGFRAYLYGVVRNVATCHLEAGVGPRMLQHWKRDPDFAGVRDGDDLTEGWRKLWTDVDAQLAQASAPR